MRKPRKARYFWCSNVEQALGALEASGDDRVWHIVHDTSSETSVAELFSWSCDDVVASVSKALGVTDRRIHESVTHSDVMFHRSLHDALRGTFGGILVELRHGEISDVEAADTVKAMFANIAVAVVGATPRFRKAVEDHVSRSDAWCQHWKQNSMDLTRRAPQAPSS